MIRIEAEKRYRPRWRTLILIFVVAVLLNYLWELAQAPLYVGFERYNPAVFWHCFVASLGDGLMVMIIFAAVWIALGQRDWFMKPGIAGYLVTLIAGLVLAISVEWVAVHILKRWAYTKTMPSVLAGEIGLVPVAQMLLLPTLTFRMVTIFSSGKESKNSSTPQIYR